MLSKIHNNTSDKGLIHYFSKNAVHFRQRKNLKDKNNVESWRNQKWFWYQHIDHVTNVAEVNSFASNFSDEGQKAPHPFKS